MNDLPKVLIVSGSPLDDYSGDSSTLSNIFMNYDPDKLAQIYFETANPNTRSCFRFFQISEYLMLKKMFCWTTKVGRAFECHSKQILNSEHDIRQSSRFFSFVRRHRSVVFYYFREILWGLGFWKNSELKNFIVDYNPDVIWCDSYPYPFMHRLNLYISKIARKPAVLFLQDDVYTYKSCNNIAQKVHRFFLRAIVKKDIINCKGHFVASPMMKKEYDEIFHINSIFITKGISAISVKKVSTVVKPPIKLLYMGNVIYGRIYSIIEIAKAVDRFNEDNEKIQFHVYTINQLSDEQLIVLNNFKGVYLQKPVPYNKIGDIISKNDVLVLVESFDKRFKNTARLSFSTKITDYLQTGKCIFAVGPSDIAPIDYLKQQNAAMVVDSPNEIYDNLGKLFETCNISKFARAARECALKNHEKADMDLRIFCELKRVANFR